MAAKTWGSNGEIMSINKPIKKSFEEDFNKIATRRKENSFIYLCDKKLNTIKHFRYIGVVYNKKNEIASHYIKTNINKEFDVIIFFRRTHALDNCNIR